MLMGRLTLGAAGVAGAIGVAAAAAASHIGESRTLAAVSVVCLAHAPALLALGLVPQMGRWLAIASGLLAGGTLFFAADLGVREWLGHGLFPGAAPLGGVAMIGGWLSIVVFSMLARRADAANRH
jgi:uncharacterized membrane protein YgdD (TMEM256/DUF423 family)